MSTESSENVVEQSSPQSSGSQRPARAISSKAQQLVGADLNEIQGGAGQEPEAQGEDVQESARQAGPGEQAQGRQFSETLKEGLEQGKQTVVGTAGKVASGLQSTLEKGKDKIAGATSSNQTPEQNESAEQPESAENPESAEQTQQRQDPSLVTKVGDAAGSIMHKVGNFIQGKK